MEYHQHKGKPVQKNAVGVPVEINDDHTPVQPIIIHVPDLPRDKGPHVGKLDLGHFLAVVLTSIVLSGTITVYVATRFLEEYSSRIDKQEELIEKMDKKTQALENKTTRLEAQMEQLND
jgi:hypothetical protein